MKPLFASMAIRIKLTIAITLLIAAISVFTFLYYPGKLRREAYNSTFAKADSIARMTAFSVAPAILFNDRANMEEAVLRARRNPDLVYLLILDAKGQVLVSFNPEKAEAAGYTQTRQGPQVFRAEKAYGVFTAATIASNGTEETVGELFLGLSLSELESRIAGIKRTSGLVSLAVLLIGLVLVLGISTVITRPLNIMTEAVREIAAGDLSRRAIVKTNDEVGSLARSFNVMVDNLEKARTELKTLNAGLEKTIEERSLEIRERIRAEKELRRAKEEAETANLAKSDFLASMSHELRTPLNAVMGFSQVLEERYYGELNEKQAEYIHDILESAQHLLDLINDILDISKIEIGKMDLEYGPIDLRDFLEHSLIMIREKCQKHGIRLGLRLPPELSDRELWADARRLKQVLYNLLSNAAKFTPDGGAIDIVASAADGGLRIGVKDTGIGLAPEVLNKIFEPFFQVKSSLQNKTPGAGLGLSVSRQIMDLHGGKIWAESRGEGKGSDFWAWIPSQVPREHTARSETARKKSPARASIEAAETNPRETEIPGGHHDE